MEYYGAGTPRALARELPARGARVLDGVAAVRHLLRVAAGLESAVVGEDQILSQLRRAADELEPGSTDPVLHRLAQCALGLGRRVRRTARPRERGLASTALTWLAPRIGGWPHARILVVGAGGMGTAAAIAARRRGSDVTVATRTPRQLAGGLSAIGLDAAARLAPEVDGIVVALGGPWLQLGTLTTPLPPIVDLSAPPAVPATIRETSTTIDIDGLFTLGRDARHISSVFVARAEAEVVAAEAAFLRWVASRPSATAARRLRDQGRRHAELRAEAALRRLPGLDDRGQAIVRRLAAQVAADLLHAPLSRLGTDASGQANEAVRILFDV